MKRLMLAFAATTLIIASCTPTKKDYDTVFNDPLLYSKTTGQLTEVITFDIFTPPVASRIYSYSHLAAYEVMAHGSDKYNSLDGQLKDYKNVPAPEKGKKINYHFASIMAFMNVGKALTFSTNTTDSIIGSLKQLATDHGMPEDELNNSVAYADQIAKFVLTWARKDNYAETRSASKYTVPNDEGKWIPTPPGYFQAVEPHWSEIRTIAMDSASQCSPPPPIAFSKEKGTPFYAMVKQVYDTITNMTPEQKTIADFWDCNGFKLNVVGHVMYATKAMTPGGHWQGITGIVCKDQKADFDQTVYTYTGVSFALMDAFISCWQAKFTWNMIRPETYINKYMDENWKPYLQTPPFPEYTSGHAEISHAAAKILTHIYGDNISFVDSTERPWGWKDKKFNSIMEAADEAGVSRFYGGIHYLHSIEVATEQGLKVGECVLKKLSMQKSGTASIK
ncbi:MAG: phosphoesterase PA-phosphatase [Bacteroidetes bacterium]|nr:MAG: phosphoesterase PA-phosphatase [Bacteroidota bacterium]